MELKVNDLVTRISYNHDMVFRIIHITEDENYILKGVNIRLIADSPREDLMLYEKSEDMEEEKEFLSRIKPEFHLNRNDYFYLPGKILHIDADSDYLKRCLDYYHEASLKVVGIHMEEEEVPNEIRGLLEETNPSIVIITGHDAYYKRKGTKKRKTRNYSPPLAGPRPRWPRGQSGRPSRPLLSLLIPTP